MERFSPVPLEWYHPETNREALVPSEPVPENSEDAPNSSSHASERDGEDVPPSRTLSICDRFAELWASSLPPQESAAPREKPVHRCKLVLLGDTGVGKTSLAVRFVRNVFRRFEATTGGTFLTQSMELDDALVKFNIWDTAGQDRFRAVAPLYYRGAAAAVIAYDVTRPASLASAQAWIDELRERGDPDMVIALTGNKIDLLPQQDDLLPQHDDQMPPEESLRATLEAAKAYALEQDLLHFETSARLATNVQELFRAIATRLPIDPVPATEANASLETPLLENPRPGTVAERLRASIVALCCPKRCPKRGEG